MEHLLWKQGVVGSSPASQIMMQTTPVRKAAVRTTRASRKGSGIRCSGIGKQGPCTQMGRYLIDGTLRCYHHVTIKNTKPKLKTAPKIKQWSREPPTEPGKYWLATKLGDILDKPIEVIRHKNKLYAWTPSGYLPPEFAWGAWWWSQPNDSFPSLAPNWD